ncbi:hypothetical protein HBH98_212710 [Parastagonospora nodorum]|nr:hypothetical protein HBH52_191980 [Parastagonospora nodorum]KAH4059833.1 hypothetical protein HBH49_024740 [Parastagonospora nodorum]KAH4216594.1 hypothetical protein HBI06_228140 [Parastagonospora nodorum]KAH4232162.1 hypothetical protein HBI05_175040 [Parastagonospora nodorum]KAH4339095.1 hypothetical protein HBH98_212710 [Parastagonospora nodorum]
MQMYIVTLVSFFALFFPQETAALIASPAARAIVPLSQPTLRSLPHRVDICGNTPRSLLHHDPKEYSMCGGNNSIKSTYNSLLVCSDQAYCLGGEPCHGYYCNEYHDLRASTTISLTETAITSGAGPGLETVAAVVFAGGIAWYLASQNEATAAILFQPPPQKPEGSREDDHSCKDQGEEPDCDNGGGNNPWGLCSRHCTDITAGPCEEQNCPKDKTASCPAQDCNGNDSSLQCTAKGKLKGCQCCPEKLPKCPADDFKSDEEKDEDMCKADKFKGRPCKNPDFESMDKKEDTSPFGLHGAASNQPREPKEYCKCGDNRATIWSVAPEATAPCRWSPESRGIAATFSTPAPAPTPPPAPASPSPATPNSNTCQNICGAMICFERCD